MSSLETDSVKYIRDNEEDVARQNQQMLLTLNVLYTIIMFLYLLASYTIFKDWNVTGIYQKSFNIQVVFLAFILLRYGWVARGFKEISIVSTMFQLYVFTFVGVVSIFPIEMKSPAVYFAPVAIGFSVVFIHSFAMTLTVAYVGFIGYIIAAYTMKGIDLFFVDLCSILLAMVISLYVFYVLFQNRISENEARNELEKMAKYDFLTGILNKRASIDRIGSFISGYESLNHPCYAYMIIDIDYFKKVNDTYGHVVGDEALTAFGNILEQAVGEQGFAGRIGGDEFTVLLEDTSMENTEKTAAAINDKCRAIELSEKDCKLSCSVGVYFGKKAVYSYDELYKKADEALYIAKQNGRDGHYLIFE